jgi:hypothetical protein
MRFGKGCRLIRDPTSLWLEVRDGPNNVQIPIDYVSLILELDVVVAIVPFLKVKQEAIVNIATLCVSGSLDKSTPHRIETMYTHHKEKGNRYIVVHPVGDMRPSPDARF